MINYKEELCQFLINSHSFMQVYKEMVIGHVVENYTHL